MDHLPRETLSTGGSLAILSPDLALPPADLERIHVSSSQFPGLTSFALSSPSSGVGEQLSLNRIYSRVKSVASAVRDVVGGTSSAGPAGAVETQPYRQNLDSWNPLRTCGLEETDGSYRPTTITSSPRELIGKPGLAMLESRLHSDRSIKSSPLGEDKSPALLRKTMVMPAKSSATSCSSVAPVTVFRDGLAHTGDDLNPTDNGTSSKSNRKHKMLMKKKPHGKIICLPQTPGKWVPATEAFSNMPELLDRPGVFLEPGNKELRSRSFMEKSNPGATLENEDDENYEYSGTDDGVFSDTSDDDIILLDSKLPGTSTKTSKPPAKSSMHIKINRKIISEPHKIGGCTVEHVPEYILYDQDGKPPCPILDENNSCTTVQSRLGTFVSLPIVRSFSPECQSVQSMELISSECSIGPGSSLSNPPDTVKPMPVERIHRVDAAVTADDPTQEISDKMTKKIELPGKPRIRTSHNFLLPSFKITREPSSGTDSSPAPTVTTGYGQKEGLNYSVLPYGMGDDGGGVYGASASIGTTQAVSQALRQLRLGNLTRDFWMKDEVCKDCFLCGSTFSTWRRKHHCRLCGQIFCSKCMTLITGEKFGHQGHMRVCNPCLNIVNGYQDNSQQDGIFSPCTFDSWDSDIVHVAEHPSTPVASCLTGFNMPRNLRPGKTPLMAIPATRTTAADTPNRRSQILEINAAGLASSPKPVSPPSIKTGSAISRPATAGSSQALFMQHPISYQHRHQNSRSVHRLADFSSVDDRAPFHRNFDGSAQRSLPPFHADSIIDPDLAPYISDYDGSDDEQMSIFATMAPKVIENSGINSIVGPGTPIGGPKGELSATAFSSVVRRRTKSKSAGSIQALSGPEGSGNKPNIHPSRTSRRRINLPGSLQLGPSTRGKARGIMRSLTESMSGQMGVSSNPTASAASPKPSRSASMRGPLAPTVELNAASLEHIRKLLKQLLQDSEIRNADKWEKALMPILLKSTDDLNPDIRAGDDIDIRHYVKVKRIPGAKPCDTSYVSGVVFTKNLALKSMARSISQPRIVVVTFPIEYQRHQQQLMSLEPVIAQEKEFLQNMVNRIVALRPTLLLVEKNISGLALQLLSHANVATAYLVKPSVIEAVARCAQADIFSSIDKLALSHFRLGRCQQFDVKTFVHDDISGRKKTFMYLSGCPKELGCTIVLRGADMATLAVIKQVTELMVYVVYNLKLETCLMRDEFVQISTNSKVASARENVLLSLKSVGTLMPASTEEKEKVENNKFELSNTPGKDSFLSDGIFTNINEATNESKVTAPPNETVPLEDDRLPDDIPNPTYYEDMIRKHETKILSASPFVRYMQPYLLMRARGLERRLTYLRRLRDGLVLQEESSENKPRNFDCIDSEKLTSDLPHPHSEEKGNDRPRAEKFQLVKPELLHTDIKDGTKKMIEALRAIYDSEYDKALHVYETQKKQWENYLAQYDDLFDPFAHQSIAVLYSMVCTSTAVPCEGPEIRRLEFYYQNMDLPLEWSDVSLGQYVEYHCETAENTCNAVLCDKKMVEHHRSYVHGQARVSVLVSDKIACPIQGMENTIFMWSYCKICPNANTPAIPMSESSWKYSFGKYLELTFWSSDMKLRASSCPHDLNRDHVRCFGYRGLTVVFQYDPIELLEIVVPRTKVIYKPEIDLRIRNEQYLQHEEKIGRFFGSVKSRLKSIRVDSVAPEKIDACKIEIESLLLSAETEQEWLVTKLQEKYNQSKYYEIIPLNRALRALQEKVVEWDSIFASFDNNYFPSEKDIRRLATLQLKKIFLDQRVVPSYDNEPTPSQEIPGGSGLPPIDGTMSNSSTDLSSKHAHDVLASVVEADHSTKESTDPSCKPDCIFQINETGIPENLSALECGEDAQHNITPKQDLIGITAPNLAQIPVSPREGEALLPLTDDPVVDSTRSQSSPSLSGLINSISAGRSLSDKKITARPKPSVVHMSSIPRPEARKKCPATPPPLSRTTSVPDVPRRKELKPSHYTTLMPSKRPLDSLRGRNSDKNKADKIPDKFRLPTLSKKTKEREVQIPRSIPNPTANPQRRVSSLAKHFEQLSKEFERERAREKRQLAAKRSRALPVATSRPIVEVYRNVKEAVEEASDEELPSRHLPLSQLEMEPSKSSMVILSEPTVPHTLQSEEPVAHPGLTHSDADASDGEISLASDHENLPATLVNDVLPSSTDATPLELAEAELPKHKSTWMKMLSNFWAERSASGWTSLEYPLHPTDHVFNDSDIIVREDEPSSLIAFALNCQDYADKLEDIRHSDYSHIRSSQPNSERKVHKHSFNIDEHPQLERSLLKTTGTHLKYQFQEGSARMFCKIFYAEQFDALRRNCGVADRYVESLSRCIKWDSKGGKTRALFLKTHDDRIVLKQLSPIETTAFIKFAPAYFQFMSEAFFHELPTVIAKMLGFYQISIKNPTTGTEIKLDVLVMENLFYDRKTTRMFDLKGSMRNRYMQATGEQNEVLLDENMVEFIYESPLFVREHSKKLLRASLWNDTLFLSRQNVMDYSLMVGIDEEKKELVVGIIDCIRTFTWDKKLENWVKKGGFAGGGKNQAPTVVSPREYKHRFREAMERYFLEAPSCWHLFRMNYMGAVRLQLHNTLKESAQVAFPDHAEKVGEAGYGPIEE